MKKVLLVTTVSGFVPQFEMSNVRLLQKMGYEVHYASNFHIPTYTDDNTRLDNTDIMRHQIDFTRSPFSTGNLKAYFQLKKLMNTEEFHLAHCHTPMGGVLTRIAAKKTNIRPIIYTAHGFHFYKGAPLINWILYYPVERCLAKYTDCLITINKEDHMRALDFKLREGQKVRYISGVGINSTSMNIGQEEIDLKRRELGLSPKDMVLVSVGELNKGKNQKVVIEAMAKMKNNNVKYLICGRGKNLAKLKKDACRYNLEENVFFLGYRNDVKEILCISDIFVFPSLREGLSVSIMEAMVAGLPVICSKIRGNTDLIDEDEGGYLIDTDQASEYAEKIDFLCKNKVVRVTMGRHNQKKIDDFSQEKVSNYMEQIYSHLMEEVYQ